MIRSYAMQMGIEHRLLLTQVGRIYERHEYKNCSKINFNIFATLRKSSDEVNLHSRFLHALLDLRESPNEQRHNLEDFLTKVAGITCFPVDGVNVRREFDNIDLLIDNVQRKQAVVIENKIWSGDTVRQLQNYHEKLLERTYHRQNIYLVYLTPFGDSPSKQSIGDLDCKEVSYRDDVLPWLKRCHQRAFNDPALRESIAQYRELVMKLTNTDRSAEYMTELKNLCLENDNHILAHELSQALIEAESELICKFGEEINGELVKIVGFPSQSDGSWNHKEVRKRLTIGWDIFLYYQIIEGAWFTVATGEGTLWYGVFCEESKFADLYTRLKDILSKFGSECPEKKYPWYRYVEINTEGDLLNIRELSREGLTVLQSEERRREIAKLISTQMAELLREIKKNNII